MKQLITVLYCTLALLLALPACKNAPEKKESVIVEDAPLNSDTLKAQGLINLDEATDLKTILSQTWDNKEDMDDLKYSEGSDLQTVNRGYSFFKDGSMIKNPRGSYRQGTWTLNEAKKPYTLEIRYKDGTTEALQVAKLDAKHLTLNEGKGAGDKKLVAYLGEALSHENIQDEPFHISNNSWRIRPSKPESEEAIRARLKGCVHFFVLFYDHSIHSNTQTVTFSGLPSCFRWYSGGIYLQKENVLQPEWINCFYDKKQAFEAYAMAEDMLAKKYTWPKGERNWMKQNVFVLKQMEEQLRIKN